MYASLFFIPSEKHNTCSTDNWIPALSDERILILLHRLKDPGKSTSPSWYLTTGYFLTQKEVFERDKAMFYIVVVLSAMNFIMTRAENC